METETKSQRTKPLRVLAVDPFHGGSHRQFLRGVDELSRHDWTILQGKPVHWKWRMRSAPLELAAAAREAIGRGGDPDVVFCTDMLDLPQWRGLVRDPRVLSAPTAIYFHENQWTYPVSQEARVDFHFGYTNLVSALAADACWFNSRFHRDEFLQASRAFVGRMPDSRQAHDFTQLGKLCDVIPPGFNPPDPLPARSRESGQFTIGWVSRWEHDKRPDRFVDLISRVDQQGVDFQLVLLGPRPRETPACLESIRQHYSDRILYDGFAETRSDYWSKLADIDIVVSAADHEFFGIAVCEAIWAGATPVLPNRLSYPELAPFECLYDSIEQAVDLIKQLKDVEARSRLLAESRAIVEPLRMENTVRRLDDAIAQLVI